MNFQKWVFSGSPGSFLSCALTPFMPCLKVQGHVTVNKPVISIIYFVSHTWPLCSGRILVDGVNLLES